MSWWDASRVHVEATHAALRKSKLLIPLSQDEAETRLWQNHDLASFAEHRLGLLVDPLRLDEKQRSELIRLAAGQQRLDAPHNGFMCPYWLRCVGQPGVDQPGVDQPGVDETVGTVALSLSAHGRKVMSVGSLYVRGPFRRRGHARGALEAIYAAALRQKLSGIELVTSWCWQPAVHTYLALSMWVRMWKRELNLIWHKDLPRWSLAVDGDEARFQLHTPRRRSALTAIVAERRGTRLNLREEPAFAAGEARFLAPGTLALALALRGWPLLRSDELWQQQCDVGFSDGGGPEGLAFKIQRWEAWARHNGWQVNTPRIPGLDYPSWLELNRES